MINHLEVGDAVELKVDGTITAVLDTAVIINGSWLVDTTHLDAVTAKRHRKAKPGDVISGRRFKNTWWKRGTVIVIHDQDLGRPVLYCPAMLTADGWFATASGNIRISFDCILDEDEIELLVVPE